MPGADTAVMVLLPVVIIMDMQYLVECGEKIIWLRRVTNMAALGYEYGCAGLRIWLRWVTNMAALGYEYDCVG